MITATAANPADRITAYANQHAHRNADIGTITAHDHLTPARDQMRQHAKTGAAYVYEIGARFYTVTDQGAYWLVRWAIDEGVPFEQLDRVTGRASVYDPLFIRMADGRLIPWTVGTAQAHNCALPPKALSEANGARVKAIRVTPSEAA